MTVLFDQTQSEDILLLLLQKLQQRFLMDEMLTYMDTYPEKWIGSMQWSDYLFVFANTNDRVAEDANGFQPVYEYAENLFIQQSISSQDRSWYQALTARWKGDTDKMLAMLDDVSDHRYSAMKKDIQTQVEFREQQNDVPVYYRDTLISLVLLQYGYLKPAQR